MLNTINGAAQCPIGTAPPAAAELEAIKARQRATWASGDYGFIGTTLQIVGELLCEAVDLRAGLKVLDVAAGNGNCSLAAARRWCEVTSTDYVPALLEDGRRRAEADRFQIKFQEADAEALPLADESFDAVCRRSASCSCPIMSGWPANSCVSAARKDASAWQTGRPADSSDGCSR
jgi:SAM-dependent methyltransferase